LAASDEVKGVTGTYFVNCRPKATSAIATDVDAARRLWDLSAELAGLD
jgi:hypothetical protein